MTAPCDCWRQPCERCGTAIRATTCNGNAVCWPCRDEMENEK